MCRRSDAGHPLPCFRAQGGASPKEVIPGVEGIRNSKKQGKGLRRVEMDRNATGNSTVKNCNEEYVMMV